MRIEFTPDVETGIKLIDEEHKTFFKYINAAYDGLENNGADAVEIAKNLYVKLRDYADIHFRDEEAYMQENDDVELVRQIHEHENFRNALKEMEAREPMSIDHMKELVDFLTKWLYRHILTSDTLIGKEHSSGKYTLTKEFITNIDFVDEQHKMLFEIIGRAWDVLEDSLIFDKYDKILSILNELKVYTQHHFEDEENYMKSIDYDGLDAQLAAHNAFIDRVVNLDLDEHGDMDEDQDKYLRELLKFLNDWLINHILKMDKKIPAKK